MPNESTIQILREFEQTVDAIYGVYLDSTTGFERLKKWLEEQQSNLFKLLKECQPESATIDYLDRTAFTYGKSDPNSPVGIDLHRCTQKEYKQRNSEEGKNYKFIGNMALVCLYQYWEDHYRDKIAESLGKIKNDLFVPVMGDLRLLRRSIIHHDGIALKDVENCEILKWFSKGDVIFIDKEKFENIIFHIKEMLRDFSAV